MTRLNYDHLLYFATTAREGSVTAAAKKLRLSQPTLSSQIRQLEEALGEPLFERQGRRLELTEAGRTALRYAEEIFGLGAELVSALEGRPTGQAIRFTVGISDVLPKLAVYRVLEPALRLPGGVRIDAREGELEGLLGELGAHRLDLVLADTPLPPGSPIRAWNHPLGDSGLAFFAAPALADQLSGEFPACLDGAPMLLPGAGTSNRRSLDEWLDRHRVRPRVVGEIHDSALLKSFGAAGAGVFAATAVLKDEIEAQYGVRGLGHADEVRERYWAISAERRIRHPAVVAIVAAARSWLRGEAGADGVEQRS